ncbi:hypothetical protein NARC_180055 [Candidatus Nitrosocosmicus arcticus]|uniref:Uncharacterized protein n=1 Tax=Candidatus Nitrosocosmicus arcticus TaxID=2035267 RepID=A0A557SRL3_9ARCH|nr:hypothetical protein NARC_180055 [Candidatus Nitrosocosmicus arcticus]
MISLLLEKIVFLYFLLILHKNYYKLFNIIIKMEIIFRGNVFKYNFLNNFHKKNG